MSQDTPDEEQQALLEVIEKIDAALRSRKCPDCGSDVSKAVDSRQPSNLAYQGIWVTYRCQSPNCEFRSDQCEPH